MTADTLLSAPLRDEVVLDAPAADDALRRRLAELGLRCGSCVRPLQRTPGGGMIVDVRGSRIALDRSTCACLLLQQRLA
ncbi:ferrous iron transport protein A [Brachybacterium sp. EF45031]|uniref:FeoA family protein n=1 Tax=Brachybacterium sillae TaxID=2810536 RepID=UPI00217DBCB2|nr:FeoA family protein [Brachybacterium sillae]MCS6712376.1 ferrous iron transport protein A [Brachybacterium sillae]